MSQIELPLDNLKNFIYERLPLQTGDTVCERLDVAGRLAQAILEREQQWRTDSTLHFEVETGAMTGKPSEKAGFYTMTMFDEQGRALKLRVGREALAVLADLASEAVEDVR